MNLVEQAGLDEARIQHGAWLHDSAAAQHCLQRRAESLPMGTFPQPAEDAAHDCLRRWPSPGHLTIREDALHYLTDLALHSGSDWLAESKEDLEQQKAEQIALCERRITAAVNLYGDGRISRENYRRRVDQNERELMHWRALTSETEQKAVELRTCIEAINRVSQTWETADDEDRKGMAQQLFSEVVFDLDTRRIESFKLKPWADEFVTLRMELHYDEFGDLEEGSTGYQLALEKANSNTLLGCWDAMPHRGLKPPGLLRHLAGSVPHY